MTRSRLERSLVGPAGEHYVLFRLHQLGILSSLAPKNAPDVDVLAFADGETVTAAIQVKTRTYGADGGWHMSEKHETLVRPRLFYAFVDLEPEVPVTFIVPSATVADVLATSHRVWLAAPGKDGRAHNDTKFRRLRPDYPLGVKGYPKGWLDRYRERWELISTTVGEPVAENRIVTRRSK